MPKILQNDAHLRIALPLINFQRLIEGRNRLAHHACIQIQLPQFTEAVRRAGLIPDAALDLQALAEALEGVLWAVGSAVKMRPCS